MTTSFNKSIQEKVTANHVRFDGNLFITSLSDGREVALPMDQIQWLNWLAQATPEQRENWSIEPKGYAIYWEDLDDGVEVCHLLTKEPLV